MELVKIKKEFEKSL
jgi:hypothetical protein